MQVETAVHLSSTGICGSLTNFRSLKEQNRLLTERAHYERMWKNLPELAKLLDKKQLSLNWTGPTSVSDNIFDSVTRLVRIYALVKDNEPEIEEAAKKIGSPLHLDLMELSRTLSSAGDFFSQESHSISRFAHRLQGLSMSIIRDRIDGVLFGLAAGDRNGGPLKMTLCLAESLLAKGRFDLEDVGIRYLNWWPSGGFDTGPTAEAVFSLVDSGMSFNQAAKVVHEQGDGLTAGCNPAHRSAVFAMSASLSDEELPEVAKAEAAITHRHPLAGDVAAAVVCLCRALIRGAEWEEARHVAGLGRMPETRTALQGPPINSLRLGGYPPDVLGAAVRFLTDSASFPVALKSAIEFAGPENYSPVLVGCIGGAR